MRLPFSFMPRGVFFQILRGVPRVYSRTEPNHSINFLFQRCVNDLCVQASCESGGAITLVSEGKCKGNC